ncbi:hypothetical protein BD413DRAFT_256748 [Trametes elegans]|nr:hypothetical protein BD413DRAFT_256748 [Trametes elegans]
MDTIAVNAQMVPPGVCATNASVDVLEEESSIFVDPVPQPTTLDDKAPSSPPLKTVASLESLSLHTGILSDITEAEEPNSTEPSRPSADDLLAPEESQGANKAGLSFSSFGSSYTATHSADTSIMLPIAGPLSSTPARREDGRQDIRTEVVLRLSFGPNTTASGSSTHLPSTVLASLSLSSSANVPQQVAIPRGVPNIPQLLALESASQSADTSAVAVDPEPISEVLSAPSPAPEDRKPETETQPTDSPNQSAINFPIVPAPSTYAEATNLALQYPQLSSKLLNEPLASACPSHCPTPVRSASPVRRSTHASPTRATLTKVASPSDMTPTGSPKKPAHTADRPNWALAPDEPTTRQGRPRERARASLPTRPRGQSREGERGTRGTNAGKSIPVQAPAQLTFRQPSPDKPPASEVKITRKLRKEKAEPWLHRVSSWVEQTSNTIQKSPEAESTSLASGSSPALASAAKGMADAQGEQKDKASRPASVKSPLNPYAPAWEFKAHQRAVTMGSVNSSASTAFPVVPALPVNSPQQALDTDLQRLRAMLRDCGLEKKTMGALPQQFPSFWSPGVYAPPPMPVRTPAPTVENVINPQVNTVVPLGTQSRQRTQTYHPAAQRPPWQAPAGTMSMAGTNPTQLVMLAAPLSSLAQLSQQASGASATLIRDPSIQNAPPFTVRLPPCMPSSSAPGALPPPNSQGMHASQEVRAGRQPGPLGAAQPPAAARPHPPPASSNATAPARFYGIETPRIVYDKHGWTVNNA